MKETIIKVKDINDFEAVISLMLQSGMEFCFHRKDCKTAKEYASQVYHNYPYPYLRRGKMIDATCAPENKTILAWPYDATEIIDFLFNKSYIVNNVGDYDAEVTLDGIKVGCQTVSFEKFDELVKTVEEFKKDNP